MVVLVGPIVPLGEPSDAGAPRRFALPILPIGED
jgi:hypothetical protein